MLIKRGKFLTFVFSLLPGAGHMFMGFMKLGVSFMGLFFLVIFAASWLNFGALTILVPIIWFYAFFDCINKTYASDEVFQKFEDNYLLSQNVLNDLLKYKGGLAAGIVLVILGIYIFFNNIIGYFGRYMSNKLYDQISFIFRSSPQFLIGGVIILLGIWLIVGKKKRSDNN